MPLLTRLSRRIYFLLSSFSGLALAALQNVTVDDAALTGTLIPSYLPYQSYWNQGNDCQTCSAKPDPSSAYDGTWHDTTFFVNNTPAVDQGIEFTFIGSELYIFFILANTIPSASYKITNVSFTLDGVLASSFLYLPSSNTSYEYNQVVYANNSLPLSEHTMQIEAINDTVNNVLILFDYLIYATDESLLATTSVSPSSTSTSSPSTSSRENIGGIVGGIVAGVGALVVAIACLLYYRRHKKRANVKHRLPEMAMADPFVLSLQTPTTPSEDVSLSDQRMQAGLPITEARLGKLASPRTLQPSRSDPLPNSTGEILEQVGLLRDELARLVSGSSGVSNSGSGGPTAEILEQVGLLRNEVTRLRRQQDHAWDATGSHSIPPPEYS